MKKLLLLLACSWIAWGQGTPLPGPVSALPSEDHMTNYGVCAWDKAQSHQACLKTEASGITTDHTISVNDNAFTFDTNLLVSGNVVPTSTLSYSLGISSNEWAAVHTQAINNYGSNFLNLYSDLHGIAITTGANEPIQFYTQSVLRGQFTNSGLSVNSLSGGSVPKPVCADSAGLLSAAANCHADINLYQKCTGGPTSLTGSYQSLCSGLTISITGTWLISWTAEFDVSSPNVAAAGFLNINGTPQTTQAFVGAAHGGAPAGLITASTGAATLVTSMNSGDTINISGIQAGSGTPVSDFVQGSLSATFLHP